MRLKSARIQCFRSVRDLTVEFGDLTRIVGANGAGKSTILRALDLFYASAVPHLSRDDFFDKDESAPVDIALTFTDFSDEERESFGSRIAADDTMMIARVITQGGGRANGKYFGMALRNPDFSETRSTEGAREKVAAYRQLRQTYTDLTEVTRGGDVEGALQEWEANHPDQCRPSRDEGAFFGFTNVGHGRLIERTRLVYVPAVRDASADVAEKNSPVAELLELVVKSAVEAKPEIKKFREETELRFRDLMNPANLTELDGLSGDLTGTLQAYYGEAAVKLAWRDLANLVIPFPAAEMSLDDDGVLTAVDRTGHGLQRALILTLLQHLAMAVAHTPPDDETEGEKPPPARPGLVLAIEEPELYQHPTKQRHFARVLEKLASGEVPGVATATQVIFTTHSPLFLSMERFEDVRLVRRHRPNLVNPREADLRSANLLGVVRALESAAARPIGTFTPESLKPKLHIIDATVAEGFFACVAVVVEGVSDKAAIIGAATLRDINLEALEIAVIAAHGKTNIDKPCAIFRSLGIPVFAIWDNDLGAPDKAPACNKILQRLMGVPEGEIEPAPARIAPTYACFANNLEVTLRGEIGDDVWGPTLDALKDEFGVSDRDDAQKVPAIMTRLLASAAEQGRRSATLDAILDAILALKPRPVAAAAAP